MIGPTIEPKMNLGSQAKQAVKDLEFENEELRHSADSDRAEMARLQRENTTLKVTSRSCCDTL